MTVGQNNRKTFLAVRQYWLDVLCHLPTDGISFFFTGWYLNPIGGGDNSVFAIYCMSG